VGRAVLPEGIIANRGLGQVAQVSLRLERIAPAEAGEAREVGIVGVQLVLMLDRDGGEVGVRRQVPRHSDGA
jgi:hypothetical protein